MTSTAKRAGVTTVLPVKQKTEGITFKDKEHEEFYFLYLPKCRTQDVCHKALIYCLGISADTRNNINQIFNIRTDCINTDCLYDGWISSGSAKAVRLAFSLYCNSAPSDFAHDDLEEQLDEYGYYTVEDLFCCGLCSNPTSWITFLGSSQAPLSGILQSGMSKNGGFRC